MAFNMCLDFNIKDDGPMQYFIRLMEKTKAMAPEDWNGGWNWDQKPVPPEVEFDMESDDDGTPLTK